LELDEINKVTKPDSVHMKYISAHFMMHLSGIAYAMPNKRQQWIVIKDLEGHGCGQSGGSYPNIHQATVKNLNQHTEYLNDDINRICES
jgi:hypothetical protein